MFFETEIRTHDVTVLWTRSKSANSMPHFRWAVVGFEQSTFKLRLKATTIVPKAPHSPNKFVAQNESE